MACAYGVSFADVGSAYLHTFMGKEERVFVRLPKPVVEVLKDIEPELIKDCEIEEDGSMIAALLKWLYGLKESGRKWNILFTAIIIA